MAEVLQFKQRPVKGTQTPMIDRERYHCGSCQRSLFVLTFDKHVVCANCYSLAQNLTLVDKRDR